MLVLVLALVTGIGTSRAIGDEAPGPIPATPGTTPPLPYQVKVVTLGIVEIGQPVLIGIYGSFATDLKSALDSDAETTRKNLKLYLDDVPIEGLPKAEVLPPEAAIDLKSTDPKPSYVVRFVLNRNSNIDLNRKAWDTLLP